MVETPALPTHQGCGSGWSATAALVSVPRCILVVRASDLCSSAFIFQRPTHLVQELGMVHTNDGGATWGPLSLHPSFKGPGVLSTDGTEIHDLVRQALSFLPGPCRRPVRCDSALRAGLLRTPTVCPAITLCAYVPKLNPDIADLVWLSTHFDPTLDRFRVHAHSRATSHTSQAASKRTTRDSRPPTVPN